MPYEPRPESQRILSRAWYWIQSVEYSVTARWVFYRLLQDSIYSEKGGYKHLLGLLSKARKQFYEGWRPWTLADDSRAPVLMEREGHYTIHLRGSGFESEREWLDTLKTELNCPLDRWESQPTYAEAWFEAAAMQGQFLYYANPNLPLLAFHGDVSIPEKWRAAQRIAEAWEKYHHPVKIFYFGDYDPKGLIIPESAWRDIELWAYSIVAQKGREAATEFHENLTFTRIGINEEQIEELGIPENPDRPGTYQWEALNDDQAEELIASANENLDMAIFEELEHQERDIASRLKSKL